MDQELLKQIIAKIVAKLTANSITSVNPQPFQIGVSNRHIHLEEKHLEILFGQGYMLKPQKELSQPGQYAAKETVMIAGPKGCLEQVRVLGPVRKQTQVEVSKSDTFKLGVSAPIRESGKLECSGEITVIGPKGSIHLNEGLIIAQRHIHMQPSDAASYGVIDGQIVQVKAGGERGLIFDNVVVRVNNNFALEFHIDTDEANGAGIKHGDITAYLLYPQQLSTNSKVDRLTYTEEKAVKKEVVEEPKKLVTEQTVRDAYNKKAVLAINKGVICTPLARDTIKELGVSVIWK